MGDLPCFFLHTLLVCISVSVNILGIPFSQHQRWNAWKPISESHRKNMRYNCLPVKETKKKKKQNECVILN